jgi:hypothetical protein
MSRRESRCQVYRRTFRPAASFDTYDSPIEMTETARTFGVVLTPLEVVVRKLLK